MDELVHIRKRKRQLLNELFHIHYQLQDLEDHEDDIRNYHETHKDGHDAGNESETTEVLSSGDEDDQFEYTQVSASRGASFCLPTTLQREEPQARLGKGTHDVDEVRNTT